MAGLVRKLSSQRDNELEKLSGEFQYLLLRHLYHDHRFASDVSPYIKPEYFEEQAYALSFVEWNTLYHKLALPPNETVLLDYLRSNLQVKRIVRQLFHDGPLPQVEAAYVADHMMEFIQFQAMRTALMECAQPLLHGDVKTMRELLQSALQVGLVGQGKDVRYVSGVKERLMEAQEERLLYFMIPKLDHIVQLQRGELLCGVAQTGVGKSHFMTWLAMAALIQRKKCMFYSLEMSEHTLMRRMDAAFASVPVRELLQQREKVLKKVEQLGVMFGDNIIFRKFPVKGTSSFMLSHHLQSLVAAGFQPDLICVDSADDLEPSGTFRKNGEVDSNREGRDVYVDLLAMGEAVHAGVATVSQAQRGDLDTIGSNTIAGAIEKARKSTIVIGLCQTPTEKRSGKFRLLVDKNRNEISGVMIGIQSDFKHGRFYVKNSDQEVEITPPKAERQQKSKYTVNSRKLITPKE